MGYRGSDFYESTETVIPASELVQHNNDADAHPALRAICDRALGLAESAEDAKNKNVSGGYAGLNAEGKLFVSLLPVITETLIGKGAVTAEKLSEEVLALFDSYAEKEDGKGLSKNDYTDEDALAVSEISVLKRKLTEIAEKYLDKSALEKHVSDESIHVSADAIDNAIKTVNQYIAKCEEYYQGTQRAAQDADYSKAQAGKFAEVSSKAALNAAEAEKAALNSANRAENAAKEAADSATENINENIRQEILAQREDIVAEVLAAIPNGDEVSY